jgi:uncharacterized protein YjbJ (UPF0337 family)
VLQKNENPLSAPAFYLSDQAANDPSEVPMHRQFVIGSIKLAHGLVKEAAGRLIGRPGWQKDGRIIRAEGRIRQQMKDRLEAD